MTQKIGETQLTTSAERVLAGRHVLRTREIQNKVTEVLEQIKTALEQRNAAQRQELAEVKQRTAALKQELAEKEQRIAEENQRTAALKQEIAEATQRTIEATQRTIEANQRTAALKQETAEANQRTMEANQRAAALRATPQKKEIVVKGTEAAASAAADAEAPPTLKVSPKQKESTSTKKEEAAALARARVEAWDASSALAVARLQKEREAVASAETETSSRVPSARKVSLEEQERGLSEEQKAVLTLAVLNVMKEDLESRTAAAKATVETPAHSRQESSTSVYRQSVAQQLPPGAFGKNEWRQYLGVDVGEEPPLPDNLSPVLAQNCPFFSSFFSRKKVLETHVLILVPQMANGRPLTLNALGELFKQRGYQYSYNPNPGLSKEWGNALPPPSHWVLMTKDVIPESRQKTFNDQRALMNKSPDHAIPSARDVVTLIFMECLRGSQIGFTNAGMYTRCREMDGGQSSQKSVVIVGGLGQNGLVVALSPENSVAQTIGMAGVWSFLPNIAFGKTLWEKFFGAIDEEPPLSPDIETILSSPCPFWPNKTVRNTHMLILVPKTVNGRPLTLKTLGELVQKPRQGTATKYSGFGIGQYPDSPVSKAHWALMTRDVIPDSRNKSYSDQQAFVARYGKGGYEVPTVLDAAVCLFMEYFRTGTRFYMDSPYTYTRCQEKYDNTYQLVVGGFAPGGLYVSSYHFLDIRSGAHDVSIGTGGLRKF